MPRSRHIRAPSSDEPRAILRSLASRVRSLRGERGWTRDELSRRSGLSVRFLARVETGEGNISIVRLEALARALGTSADRLIVRERARPAWVSLVGLRGAGKSTVGPLLARRLDRPFIEMDTWIEEAAGLPLDQIFELHGERYYRRVENETLRRVLSEDRPAVLAAAGGVVTEPATWQLLSERTTVVWLHARPEDHWDRVIAQGDRRPMADNPAAMDELRAMLAAREKMYAQADLTVRTSRLSPDEVAQEIESELAGSS